MDRSICLNLGCGARTIDSTEMEEWYNIDKALDLSGILNHDLNTGLPSFLRKTNNVMFVNMCQFLEHMNLTHAMTLLDQCRTALIPEVGIIRISVPDAGLLYDRFLDDRLDEFIPNQPPIYKEMNNPMIRLSLMLFGSLDKTGESGHKMMYSHGSLKYLLEYMGFSDIVYESFNPKYDAQIASNHQLCLEARKK